MSVPSYNRHEGKLEVLESARKLMKHTLSIIQNEKNFPKRSRWIITKPIVDEVISVVTNIRKANSVRVEISEDYILRRKYQYQAFASVSALYTLLDAAYLYLGLASNKIEYWTGLCFDTELKLKAWIKADKERYKNI